MTKARLLIGLWFLLGCGDDGAHSPDAGGEPEGEPCMQPGQTQTGCGCEGSSTLGVRNCTDELVWTPCACPPPPTERPCTPGDPVVCNPCPGQSEPRRGLCLQGNTAECPPCDGEPADAGMIDGG